MSFSMFNKGDRSLTVAARHRVAARNRVADRDAVEARNGRYVSRRDFLFRAGEGIGGLALTYLLNRDGLLAAGGCENIAGVASPYAAKSPHFKPRAKNVISLFMCGGVSHIDTFDPKP